MLRTRDPWIVLVLLVTAPAAAQDIFVDYDRATAFSRLKTFQFIATGEDLRRGAPELHQQVVDALRGRLREAKLEEVSTAPDIYVTYHASTRERFSLETVFEYVYADNWSWGSYWDVYGSRTSRVVTFTEGSLVIDVFTAENKELIWRGIAVDTVSDKTKKNSKKIDRAIRRIAKQWEKMYPYGRALRSRNGSDR